jgi:zinc transport system substrate-binding protein
MKYQKTLIFLAAWLIALALVACGSAPPADQTPEPAVEATDQATEVTDAPRTIRIAVSILPQKYFVERVGGEHVEITVMVPPGSNPETYEPRPAQLRELSDAEAYMLIRVPFEEAWMDRIASANPNMRLVDTIVEVERMPMLYPHTHEDDEEHADDDDDHDDYDDDHDDEYPDPHVWLSPIEVERQVRAIHAALVELDPANQDDYDRNLEAFVQDLHALREEIEATLADVPQRKFMVFHPAWGYFARDFDLEMIPVEVHGREPSAAELAMLIREAREENIRVIFAQPEFSTAAAETIADEIGGEVVLISPLEPDWLENMRRVADTFARVLADSH